MKRILLVRHAECEMNLKTKGFIGGQSNSSPLTPLGQRQAAALGRHLCRQHPVLASPVYSSTATRAEDTAKIILQQWQGQATAVELVSLPLLLELNQGDWEGKPRSECYTPKTLAVIQADPWNFSAPGGESQRQVEGRMTDWVATQLLPSLDYDGPPAVVVTHGLAIKCFLRSVLGSNPGMTWKIDADNTSITEVAWVRSGPGAGWHLKRLNDTTHLALAGLTGAPQQQRAAASKPTTNLLQRLLRGFASWLTSKRPGIVV